MQIEIGSIENATFELAYAYRMVNTRQVDECVERVRLLVSHDRNRWHIHWVDHKMDAVGSDEAMQFFGWHQQQHYTPFVLDTDKYGALPEVKEAQLLSTVSPLTVGHLAFVLGGVWGDYTHNERIYKHRLSKYFGGIDLPLIEVARPEGHQISVVGELDQDVFDQARFSRFVKDMTDIYDLRTRPELTHERTYWLDTAGRLQGAEAYTEAEIGGAYNVTQARTLKRIE